MRADLRRLLLVSHRSIAQAGGPAARWRSFARHLPREGWELDVVSAPQRASAVEFAERPEDLRRAARRAAAMSGLGRLAAPAFRLVGMRPDALPLSMTWIPRGALAVRRALRERRYDAVIVTAPPAAGMFAARLGVRRADVPLVVEFRDLWAGSPAFDLGGGALQRLESWVLARAAAVVACTPEAAEDLRRRHPRARVEIVPNGFEPELLERRRAGAAAAAGPRTIVHSGTLTADRPLAPLLRVLEREPYRSSFRLVLHGHVAPAVAAEVADADGRVQVELRPPSGWDEAVAAIAEADVTLITQARGAGDETAVASKAFEYLALGKPVLCVTDGGATERLLGDLGADRYCARLDREPSIAAALDRLLAEPAPGPLPAEALAAYDRRRLAARMAELLDAVAERR